jgi:glycosidase
MQGKKPDENIRLPMQWTSDTNAGFSTGRPWRAPAKDYVYVNVDAQTAAPDSLLEHYRALIQLRNKYSTLQTGDLIPLKSNKPAVYSALRVDETGTFLILANLSDDAIIEYNIALDKAGLAESAYSVETVFGAGQADGSEINSETLKNFKPFASLDPYAMYVLKLNPK